MFDSLYYTSTLTHNRNKFDPKTKKCVFLGNKTSTKGCNPMDLHSKEIFLSRNVSFFESCFPFSSITTPVNDTPQVQDISYTDYIEPIIPQPSQPPPPSSSKTSNKVRKTPSYLQDFHCNITTVTHLSKVKYPLSSVLSYHNLSPTHSHFIMSISTHIELKTYSIAVKHEEWRKAMDAEIIALE